MNKKHLLFLMLALFAFAPQWSVAQINTPIASPPASVYSQVGLTDVTVDYYRPKAKERAIFGEGSDFLVPYGELWRTGANSGSKVTFSDDVKIMDKDVAAGEYLIFTIPGENEWQVMLYPDLSIGGNTGAYDEAKEAARFTVTPKKTGEKVEVLTFAIEDISADNQNAELALMWENTKVELPIEVNFDDKVMASIEENTKVNPQNLVAAASYYFETGKDLEQALEWVNTYLVTNPEHFWIIHLKAQVLAKMGKKKEAVAAAEESKKLASAAQSDFGYVKRNEDLISEIKM